MARYIKNFKTDKDPQVIVNAAHNFLISLGYKYKNYQGEYVFQKGEGWLTAPMFVTVTASGDTITVSGWLKWPILPYVFTGEMNFDDGSFLGAIPKAAMKKNVMQLESIIMQNATVVGYGYPQQAPGAIVCPKCGTPSSTGGFCTSCGTKLN